jgi:hypothetical protein
VKSKLLSSTAVLGAVNRAKQRELTRIEKKQEAGEPLTQKELDFLRQVAIDLQRSEMEKERARRGNRKAVDVWEPSIQHGERVSQEEIDRLRAFLPPGGPALEKLAPELVRELRLKRDEAWMRGDLSYLMAKRPFMRANYYRKIHAFKQAHPLGHGPMVVVACRRTGKSVAGGIYLWERALRKPDTHVLFLAPTTEQCADIVRPICHWILRDCPDDIEIKPRAHQFFIKNPAWGSTRAVSTFSYYGVDHFKGKKLRGIPSTNAAFVDEVREADPEKFEYIIDSVISPTFAGVDNPLLILASSLPDDMDHPFIQRFVPQAREKQALLILPRSQNTDWSKADDENVGYDNLPIDVRDREFECKLQANRKNAIIPEFEDAREEVVVVHPRPRALIPRVAIDGGFYPDPLAAIFYYVDFIEKLLVVEDEMFLERPTTSEFACKLLDKETEIFGVELDGKRVLPPAFPVRRIADMKNSALEDLRRDQALLGLLKEKYGRLEGIYVSEVPFSMSSREGGLRALRANFRKIRIHPRCERLIYQLKTGTLNKKGDFIRSVKLGHCDGIACLRSAVRMVHWDENPYPMQRPQDGPDTWVSPGYRDPSQPSTMVITRNQTLTRHSMGIARRG